MSASEIRSLQPAADNEHASRLALLAVLRRYETGQDTAAETLLTLQMLGLRPTPRAEKERRPSTRQRRQSARRAERANDEREAS